MATNSQDARFEGPSFIDPLTRLFNRYYLDQFIPQEIKKAGLSNYPLSILMIDVDKFKKINDGYGHLCGDRVLTQVAEAIKKSIRQTDTAIRYAGDEFIILLSGADKDKTAKICGTLVNNIEQTGFTGDKNQKINVTLSIGYAVFPEDADDKTKLIEMADKALYLSKKRGRNRFASAKEVTAEEVSSLIAMESFPCRKFIDRQKELDALKGMVSLGIKSGAPQAAFIVGQSGVGKTRTLNEIIEYIKDQAIIVHCNASSQHSNDPYYLFARGLGGYIDKAGMDNPEMTDILLKMPSSELSELGLVVPQLRKLIKKSSDLTIDDKGRRFLIFKAFLNFLSALSGLLPVFIIFDDIQWSDSASLELIRHLIKQKKDKNISIICASMDDRLAQYPEAKKIELNNLSNDDTALMIEAIFPEPGRSKEFTGLVYEATKGNPYFIEEILKWLIEKGIIFYRNDAWQVKSGITGNDIPASLDDIIKSRLMSLDDETKEMILQAAVIGKNFQSDILNKLGDKNEGFISELIERAKSMHLVSDVDKTGGFDFVGDRTQDILYSQLDEDQRNNMHYKIAEALVDEHRDNIYDVAGQAAFHYSHVPGRENALKLGKELLEKTKELFNPGEIKEYLEQFAQELLSGKEKTTVELSDNMMKEAVKFILFTQGAIKKIRLYPPTSSVRLGTVKEAYAIINKILGESETLVITEVEKSLVVNGRRLSPGESEHAKAEDFVHIMMEQEIKTISFKTCLREDEIGSLINHLSIGRKDVADKGGWAALINKESLEHIGIDELHFISVDEYAQTGRGRKGLSDLMLMEFLMGKIDSTAVNREEIIHNIEKNPQAIARAITDIANTAMEKDGTQDQAKVITDAVTKIDAQIFDARSKTGNHQKDMAKIILELEPGLRHKVIGSFMSESRQEQKKVATGIMGALTDDFLIDVIMEKYKDNMYNPLLIKEFIDEILINQERKKEVLEKLEPKLLQLDVSSEDLDFVMGRSAWKDLSLERKIGILLGLPQDYYTPDALDKIADLLEDLDSKGRKDEVKDALARFLIKANKLNEKARRNLLKRISEFLKEPSGRTKYILEKLEQEKDPQILAEALEATKYIITDSAAPDDASFGIFSGKLFMILLKKVKEEESQKSQSYEVIKNFVTDISIAPVLRKLVYAAINDNAYQIKDIYFVFNERLVDALVELGTKKSVSLKDPFREFLVRKQIADLLKGLKTAPVDRLKKICAELKEAVTPSLIELIGYIQSEEMVETLVQFIHHKDPAVRMAVVQALSEIGGAKAVEALSKIAKESQDSNIRDLANMRMQKLKKKIPPQK
ncbi:MAG: diguanylate cyclase [Candidatus Omnitrophota bacterium]|nr:diguanylate cyclase [Candidatus Omnitrophota bacterium]